MSWVRKTFPFLEQIDLDLHNAMEQFGRVYEHEPGFTARRFMEFSARWMLNDCRSIHYRPASNDTGNFLVALIRECRQEYPNEREFLLALEFVRKHGNDETHQNKRTAPGEYLKRLVVIANMVARKGNRKTVTSAAPPSSLSAELKRSNEKTIKLTKDLMEAERRLQAAKHSPQSIWPEGDREAMSARDSMDSHVAKLFKAAMPTDPKYLALMKAIEGNQKPQMHDPEREQALQEAIEAEKLQRDEAKQEHLKAVHQLQSDNARLLRELQSEERNASYVDTAPTDWAEQITDIEERLINGQAPFEPWRIPIDELGSGGFGRAYRCWPHGQASSYIVKIPLKKGIARSSWAREVKDANNVMTVLNLNPALKGRLCTPLRVAPESHPCFTIWEDAGTQTLQDVLAQNERTFNLVTAAFFTAEVASVIHQINDMDCNGYRYRDIKPDNIVLRGHRPMLIDVTGCQPCPPPTEWGPGASPSPDDIATGQCALLARLFVDLLDPSGRQDGAVWHAHNEAADSYIDDTARALTSTRDNEHTIARVEKVIHEARQRLPMNLISAPERSRMSGDKIVELENSLQHATEKLLQQTILPLLSRDPSDREGFTPRVLMKHLAAITDRRPGLTAAILGLGVSN